MKLMGILVLMINVVVAELEENDTSINIVDGSSYDTFYYKIKEKFTMTVSLENIPSGVTEYILYSGTYVMKKDNIAPGVTKVDVSISVPLQVQGIEIKIKLYKKDVLCSHRVIGRGRFQYNIYNYINYCSSYVTSCTLTADFANTCFVITKTGSTVDFYCEPIQKYTKEYILQQWMQFYKGIYIGSSPQTQSKKNKFTIKVESFDNNTSVVCRSNSVFKNSMSEDSATSLFLIDNVSDTKKDVSILRYSASKEFKFYCENYFESTNFVQVGVINTKANKIEIYDRWNFKMNMASNGTVLCCVIYNIIQEDDVTHVIRSIQNKNLLIYDESVDSHGFAITISIIVAVVVGVFIILLLLGIFIYKKCHKKQESKAEEMNLPNDVELETYYVNSNPNRVLYAELDMSAPGRSNGPQEESPYANIIGVVTPLKKQ